MKPDQATALLTEQIDKLDNLAAQEDHEAYEAWHRHTELLLKQILGDSSDEVRDFGLRDGTSSVVIAGNPAENAQRDTKAYFSHIKSNRSLLTGVVEFLKSTVSSNKQTEPISAGTLDALHHAIKAKCSSLYLSKNYPEAVEKGFKVVRDRLRELTKHETGSEAFGKGGLFIRGAAADNVEHDFQEAVKFLTMAIDQFRNEKSHTSDGKIEDPVRAYEYLALSSLAMHLLDNAEVRKAAEAPKRHKQTVAKTPTPQAPQAPQAALSEPEAVWASNYSGHGASFRAVIDVDNYGGRNDYITEARVDGTNADGTPFSTDRFTFEQEQPNHPHPITADAMQRLVVFMSYDFNNHRPMPDLDRDTVKLILRFRGGRVIELPVRIRQN